MLVTNQTTQDIYFGPLHLPAGVGQQVTVDDTSDTSLYLSDDIVADAVNNAYNAGNITVSGQSLPFPRPTGTPQLVHGDGSPEGLVYAPRGSVYMRRDAAATWVLYIKGTPVTQSTGWIAVDTTGAQVPTGAISSFAGIAAPAGWLLCDGSAYSETSYAALFATIVVNKGTVTVTIASPAVFTLTNHGLIAGDIVYLETTGALPTGLSPDTPYYVISSGLTTNAFEVSATRGGSAINTSGSQSGTHTLFRAPYANANMSAGNFTVPDLRGRVAVGYSGSGGAAAVAPLGNNDGLAENVRNVSHHHTIRPPQNSGSNSGGIAAYATWANTSGATISNTSGDTNNTDFPAYQTVNYIIKI
jgi:microcystin-dependent protein